MVCMCTYQCSSFVGIAVSVHHLLNQNREKTYTIAEASCWCMMHGV